LILSKELTPIVNQINELAEGLGKTLTAVNSDALAAALDVYAAVKLNKDKVSSLNIVADEMAVFFQRTGRKTVTPAPQANIK
jgi:aspartate/tyrosine/aromatic aminotransferase